MRYELTDINDAKYLVEVRRVESLRSGESNPENTCQNSIWEFHLLAGKRNCEHSNVFVSQGEEPEIWEVMREFSAFMKLISLRRVVNVENSQLSQRKYFFEKLE